MGKYITVKKAKKKAKVIPIRSTIYIEKPIVRYVIRWGWTLAAFALGVSLGLWLT